MNNPDCDQLYLEAKGAADDAMAAQAAYIGYVEQFRPVEGRVHVMSREDEAEIKRLGESYAQAEKLMIATGMRWLTICHGMVDHPWKVILGES